MKNKFFTVVLAGLFVTGLAGSVMAQAPAAPAAAAPAPAPATPKIGVLNIQRAIVECNEGKQAADKLTTQFTPKRTELQSMQAEVDKLQTQLRTQEKTLSDDARASLVRQIETKTKEFTRAQEDATNDFQQAESQVINEIGQKMMKVVDDYARKGSYSMIVDVSGQQNPFLWWSSGVEITDDIIKLYNTASPAVAPATPAAAKPAAPGAAKPPAAKKP